LCTRQRPVRKSKSWRSPWGSVEVSIETPVGE
jgi:hypothetical protein